ncbi:SA1320 family protein, partial [Streptococcus plurextorum]|uniref:SA1320 family protein n=1 Tax=Streptococcus plurextorum TaxID=456876 RepID=UPI003CCC0A81
IGAKDIKLDPDSLRNLSSNLQMLSLVEIASLIKLCQLCQEKNNKIKEDFETRKQKVEESIVQRFKETRLTEVFYQLHDSVGQLLAKKQIFQTLMTPGQVVDTISDPAYFSTGAPLILENYNIQLRRLGQYSSTLYQHATEEKTSGFQNGVPINPTPTALKSSMVLEESAKHLKERSETIFEGKGLREGKKDGISLALDEVLSVEQKNLLELQKALSSVSQLTLSLANHFQTMDDWLHDQLSNGGNLEGMMVANVPPSYKAYLEASHIFDDVKDVLQAFDHQVEENSKRYGKEVAETFTQAFSSLQSALDRWSSELSSFNQTISSVQTTFTTSIYVDKTSFVDKKPVVTRSYWGQLWRLYPSTTYSTVNTAKNTLTPLADKVISALEVTRTASHDMQNLKPQLKKIIEEGVYKAFDLDEIVASQKIIQSITDRILRELTYVIMTISSQMQGEAVTTLTQQLEKVKSLTSYFNNLVGDCFGDQSKAQGVASTGSVSLEARTFSLNK